MSAINLAQIFEHVNERPIFQICAATLILFYALNFIVSNAIEMIGLVTANTLITNTYVWNLVTACFYEKNVAKLILDFGLLVIATQKTEKSSMEQFGLYFGFSILAQTIGTSIYCFFMFFMTSAEETLITPIYGFSGVAISLLMLARQQASRELIFPMMPLLTYNNFPLTVILFQVTLNVVGLKFLAVDVPFSCFALLFSWSYLRFYYKYNDADPPGDKSEENSFVSMFPEALHLILIAFTTAFYNIVALMGLFPPLEIVEKKPAPHHLMRYGEPFQQNDTESDEAAKRLPTPQDIIAERRRAKALKLLDAKIKELSREPEEGWDNVEAPMSGTGEILEHTIRPAGDFAKFKV